MRLYVSFSVHEQLLGPVFKALLQNHEIQISGFVWGTDQHAFLEKAGLHVEPMTVFSRDILGALDDKPADIEYLAAWEKRSGVLLQHMVFAERHLTHTHTYEQVLRLAEIAFRRAEADFDRTQPDAYFSEDVACLTSYIYWVVARDRGIRTVLMNNSRFPNRITTYSNQLQYWEKLDAIFPDTPAGALTNEDLAKAEDYIREFRARPTKPIGLLFRSKLRIGSMFDLERLLFVTRRWTADRGNPTLLSPTEAIVSRGRRLVRSKFADAAGYFEKPRAGEKYVLYPLHFQPEATTLVLGPYFLNQLALIEDIAKSLPAGYRLYVKEHVVSRGRWPLEFYRSIRRVPGVRLLGPGENTQHLINGASAIAVISGTMGWEGLLFDKPVITFGHVFYNRYPLVHRGAGVPKQDWPQLFRTAIFEHKTDAALLRRFIACAFKVTLPGLSGNPASLPQILAPENIALLVKAFEDRLELGQPMTERTPWSA